MRSIGKGAKTARSAQCCPCYQTISRPHWGRLSCLQIRRCEELSDEAEQLLREVLGDYPDQRDDALTLLAQVSGGESTVRSNHRVPAIFFR